jgi:hypothetical protein
LFSFFSLIDRRGYVDESLSLAPIRTKPTSQVSVPNQVNYYFTEASSSKQDVKTYPHLLSTNPSINNESISTIFLNTSQKAYPKVVSNEMMQCSMDSMPNVNFDGSLSRSICTANQRLCQVHSGIYFTHFLKPWLSLFTLALSIFFPFIFNSFKIECFKFLLSD